MEITTNLINEEEFINMAIIYNDIQNYFGNSINLNPQFVNEINAVYKRAFLNMGKSMLSVFNLKYLEMFEQLAEHYKCNEELYDLSISLLNVFNEDFKQLNDNLDVQNEKDFNELKFILEVSLITIEAVIEDKDIELAYEAMFQIQRQIKKQGLYKQSMKIVKPGEYELNIFMNNNAVNEECINSDKVIDFEFIID